MRVLGVDPGTRFTGVGIIEERASRYFLIHSEVIRVNDKLPIAQRLKIIHDSLSAIFHTHRPELLALENVFYGKDLRAMVKIGEARASAMLAASDAGIPVVEYAPARVKQSVTGNGCATKQQMQHMVKRLLNMKEMPPPDAADALAVAICHLHSRRFIHVRTSERQAHRKITDLSGA